MLCMGKKSFYHFWETAYTIIDMYTFTEDINIISDFLMKILLTELRVTSPQWLLTCLQIVTLRPSYNLVKSVSGTCKYMYRIWDSMPS
jgi:hypothetical protein